jgi:hypothetical protein
MFNIPPPCTCTNIKEAPIAIIPIAKQTPNAIFAYDFSGVFAYLTEKGKRGTNSGWGATMRGWFIGGGGGWFIVGGGWFIVAGC